MSLLTLLLFIAASLAQIVPPGNERNGITLSLNDIAYGETILPKQVLQYSLDVQPVVPLNFTASTLNVVVFFEVWPCSTEADSLTLNGSTSIGDQLFFISEVLSVSSSTVQNLTVTVPVENGTAPPFTFKVAMSSADTSFDQYTIRAWSSPSTDPLTGGDRPGYCGILTPTFNADSYITEIPVALSYTRRDPRVRYYLCSASTPQQLYHMNVTNPSNTSGVTCTALPGGATLDQVKGTVPITQRYTAITVVALRYDASRSGLSSTRYQVLNIDRGVIPVSARTVKLVFIGVIGAGTLGIYLFIIIHSIINHKIMIKRHIFRIKLRSFVIPIDLRGARYVLMGACILHFMSSFVTAMLGPICVLFIVAPLFGLVASILYSSLLVFLYEFFSLASICLGLGHIIRNALFLCGDGDILYTSSLVSCASLSISGASLYLVAGLVILFLQLLAHLFNIKLLRYKSWLQSQDALMNGSDPADYHQLVFH